ncbi:MAG: fibronectin type III domain-containing protein, partial [Elusimicrobiales bacterium]|nr:fibronectin type III domain-containing protein [Elusimicrobiales bacterium]
RSSFNPYSIAISFANNYKDTKATVRNLQPNQRYYFRVKARNGNDIETAYSNVVSTITVGNIVNLRGMALSTDSIKWMWNPAGGATGYEVYEYKIIEDPNDPIFRSTIEASVLIATTSYNYYTWTGLTPNSPYQIKVRSFKNDSDTGWITVFGPFSTSTIVHTLSAQPKELGTNSFSEITTGSMKISWDANGNSTTTLYLLEVSNDDKFNEVRKFNIETEPELFPYISYIVSGLKPNTRYFARVYSINNDDIINPLPANLGSKYTLAQPPPRVYVSSVSMKGVVVSWETGDNPSYTVYRIRATSTTFDSSSVITVVDFGVGFTGNSYLVKGLWLNTSYYFDVAARNMENVETFSVQTVTPAFISASIVGVPKGAIGNEIIPGEENIINGILNDGRSVNLKFDKGTFNKIQPIAITSLSESQLYSLTGSSNPCGYTFNGSTIAFGIYSNEQPYLPVEFKFKYFPSEAFGSTGISANKNKVSLARYNIQTGQCLPVETKVNEQYMEVVSRLNHFSIYQLVMINPTTSLSNVKIFPNPFYPNRSGQGYITIINLPSDAKLTFYTLSGVKVYETLVNSNGTAYWDGKNSKGQFVGSGIYFCLIESKYGKKILKLAIER